MFLQNWKFVNYDNLLSLSRYIYIYSKQTIKRTQKVGLCERINK